MTSVGLEQLCLSLKGTTLDIKWGNDLCYLIGEKMYCVTGMDGAFKVSFKVDPEEFQELTGRAGIIPAPYMARNNWVLIEDAKALSPKEWKTLVGQSYELVFSKLPKKTQEKILAKKSSKKSKLESER